MITRAVVLGSVKPDEWDHYGLALGQYTHFTSPIRRYADVVVHRLLMEAMKKQDWWSDHGDGGGGGKVAREEDLSVQENGALQELSEHLNDRNKAAQNAQRSSQALFQTLYFKGKDPDDQRCIVEAVIFSIRDHSHTTSILKRYKMF